MHKYLANCKTFIENSPTCYHAVAQVEKRLIEQGAVRLYETQPFCVEPGKCYYVVRNDSSIIAFSMPQDPKGFRLYAAHTDSPCFKVKEKPEQTGAGDMVTLNVEKYGGMIYSTWLDRPVSIAGRVVIDACGTLETRLIDFKDTQWIIPNVPIHLKRDINSGMEYQPQKDMAPLFSIGKTEQPFEKMLADKAGCEKEAILGKDLFVYNPAACVFAGNDQSLFCGPRLDDLACVYAGLEGFLCALTETSDYGMVIAFFDNEEVGSSTRQGAGSTFLTDILKRIKDVYGYTEEAYQMILAQSRMISADNAHAVHPNHPELYDATNRSFMNQGVVIKYNGNQNYTTDAYSEAWFKQCVKQAGTSYQTYANRSDLPGGSTLGKIAAEKLSISMVDIGLPQLAMHSSFETAGTKDIIDLVQIAHTFFVK